MLPDWFYPDDDDCGPSAYQDPGCLPASANDWHGFHVTVPPERYDAHEWARADLLERIGGCLGRAEFKRLRRAGYPPHPYDGHRPFAAGPLWSEALALFSEARDARWFAQTA